ncbi:MAG: DUF2314 domain-containing protein [Pseudomonadota bacterium]
MVQVRCPECGFLQTLSESRFFSIPEDYIPCPHCRARVPKEWTPTSDESMPEETQHKILAFTLRILNSGDFSREIVHALESLVRHYGHREGSAKALALAYAGLEELGKAEEFLLQALENTPEDPELLRCMMRVKFDREFYSDAAQYGSLLLESAGAAVLDEDIARLSLAFAYLDKLDEARNLLESYPDLNPRNALVKQAGKMVGRGTTRGFGTFVAEWKPLHRLIGMIKTGALKALPARVRGAGSGGAGSSDGVEATSSGGLETGAAGPGDEEAPTLGGGGAKVPVLLEYWIYTSAESVPTWESIGKRLAELHDGPKETARVLRMLEFYSEKKRLTLDYVFKRDAGDLFHYPPELIPANSRKLSEKEKHILTEARMIVRLRLVPAERAGLDYLAFMVRFVEAVRSLTDGVVQDAVSHSLWGSEEWKTRVVDDPLDSPAESHLHFEVLEERGNVWIHSHGMQKFGLPDVEMEGIPRDLAAAGRHLLTGTADHLILDRNADFDFESPREIPNTPFLFLMSPSSKDEEGHFPVGSLRILPYVADYDPMSTGTLRHVLNLVKLRARKDATVGRQAGNREDKSRNKDEEFNRVDRRRRMIDAHNRAKAELPRFKKSFQAASPKEGTVHAVKVGFPAQGGDFEWMWVTLEDWQGASIVGQLQNRPVLRRDLGLGARVQLHESEIFDWVISSRGAIVSGAYTEGLSPVNVAV